MYTFISLNHIHIFATAHAMSWFNIFCLFLLIQTLFYTKSHAVVPADKTFKFVNQGDFGEFIVEYDGTYRTLSVFNSPFQLCFYNTTPNAYTLSLRMANTRSESLFRWVWEANRGKPVKENATLTFGQDGNLVLADSDGRVTWQTATANKGVVDFKVLPNGNMVLLNSNGSFVWQSFDSPTDTLLIGQSLRVGAAVKLVSRASELDNSDGPYSLELEPNKGLSWFYQPKNSPKPLLYFSTLYNEFGLVVPGESIQFHIWTETDASDVLVRSYLSFDRFNAITNYNGTLSLLRLGIDGRLRIFTYNDKVDSSAWEEVFTQFISRRWYTEIGQECQLPEKCGKFGLCSKNQCVACPTEKGLLGWSEECELKKVSSCKPTDFHYYKLEGVEHFVSQFTRGSSVNEMDCGKKCTSDCKCLGYFYYRESSRCWNVFDIKTLRKANNSSHVGYIKVSNK
ncbi:epidermis-specific secreted glycoprotein EP1-like [Impatiens glandulifera]|uniref:epidermis-specific secreted glycoprotein EP1-like n=1 Tax=Impatiens glandulifera TaxID=253017 RepID=UPI001FB0F2F3|nr:epidermis-specific secreted glycoprotein EP1-like [Impatiens glandulifera]